MNDRFKFRVWAKPHEPTKTEGYYVDDADYMVMTPDGKVQIEYYCDNGYDGYIDSFKQDEVVIEQCTGLKDKNDKPIFEGDWLKTKDGSYCYVVWFDGFWWVKSLPSEAMDLEHAEFYRECEVVGNIHDNPNFMENEE